MKKVIVFICLITLMLGCMTACHMAPQEQPDQSTAPSTDGTTAPIDSGADSTAQDRPRYASVEDLQRDESVTRVQTVSYTGLDDIDMTQLPDNYVTALTGVRDRIDTYEILYRVDGCTVAAFVSVPDDYTENPRPVLIYNRGGNGNFGASSALDIAMIAQLTNCVVIASQYRETKPGTGTDEFGGADVHDVTFWVDRVKDMGFADRDKAYMVGVSRGGMQTCLALQADTEGVISKAVCVSGVYDLAATFESREDMRQMLTRRVGGTPTTAPRAYTARSAVDFAAELRIPLLLIHSRGDKQVDYAQATAFAEKLEQAGKDYDLITRETASHGVETLDEWARIMEWLAQ